MRYLETVSVIMIAIIVTMVVIITINMSYTEEKKEIQEIGMREYCLNGVVYYSTANQLAPKFNRKSKVVTCGVKKEEKSNKVKLRP